VKASIHFELENPEDFAAFASVFGTVAGVKTAPADVVVTPAPKAEKQIAAPAKAADKPADKPAEKAKAEEKPAEKADDEVETEVVDKALVAKELRAFIQKMGESGPKEALGVLKQFGATKFDDLKQEDYSKFLSALAKAA
jgi:hypothetical protein